MRLVTLGPASGKFAAVAADARGWVVVYQDESDGHLRLVQLHPEGSRRVPDTMIGAFGGNAFPVLTVQNGETWLAFRDGISNAGVLMNLTLGTSADLGPAHGNNPIALGNGWCAYQSTATYAIVSRTLVNDRRIFGHAGRPTGLASVGADGIAQLIDDVRLSVPGMGNPQSAGGCVVGENIDAGPSRNIARLTANGREAVLWSGQDSFTPHIAQAGSLYAVVTWGAPGGIRLAVLEDADFLTPPTALPDQPFVVDPHGVVENIAAWLFSPDQGPDVHLSPDGTIRFYCKSDEPSGDGKDPHIGEHWDRKNGQIGHLDDASTGRRILNGKEVVAEDMTTPELKALWPTLLLNHNWFKNDKRLWMPARCVSGTVVKYVTDIIWTVPPRETPHTNVWANIPITIKVDVGYGVIHGKEVRVRSSYIPDGHPEVSYYGPPKGFNAWIAGPYGTEQPEWMP